MRTFFKEGFGILGGALGTNLGAGFGLGVVAILGLGPFGLFVAVFICASVVGIIGMEIGKGFGGRIYDAGSRLDGRVYHSMDELVGALND